MLAMKARKKVIQGGTSASKSWAILARIINEATSRPDKDISIVSESVPHLRRGVMKDFRDIMKATGRWREDSWNETLRTYKFQNGSIVEFFSADQEERLRGGRRDMLFVNEANNISFEAYHQLAIRTREDIFIDFNPSSEFWAHTEVLKEKDAEHLILTYKDNEALGQTIIDDIEAAQEKAKTSNYWANWWQVYGLGQIGSMQGVVFDNWKQTEEIPPAANLVAMGMDFGYTNDPTTLIGYYKIGERIIWHEFIYQRGLLNADIAALVRGFGLPKVPIYADSAEPKSIAELRGYGLNMVPANKGRGSVIYGITVLQQKPFEVTAPSLNMIKELRHYVWATDRAGAAKNEPIDAYNHTIDPMRYVATEKLSMANSRAGFGAHLVR